MGELSARNFGLVIAYLIPGFLALWGLSFYSPAISEWLRGVGPGGPSVGGFLYVLLASIAAGMTVSGVRWAVLDRCHAMTGLTRPHLNFGNLPGRLDVFEQINEHHYRYYQFYGNSLIALAFTYPTLRLHGGGGWAADLGFLFIEVVFAAGSRDALRNFYRRATQLLGESEVSDDERNWQAPPPRDEEGFQA
jgi:hypothetical protein